jgi:L-threonylcarbamoyladenylate synthase
MGTRYQEEKGIAPIYPLKTSSPAVRKSDVLIPNPNRKEIRHAAKALKEGHLVTFPTETVYGLGADAENREALKRLFEIKRRPISHPLIIHISADLDLKYWASAIPDYAYNIANIFWPGPVTLILKKAKNINDVVTGGHQTIGLRVPRNEIALNLLKEFKSIGGNGIAAPSANLFGKVSSTNAEIAVNSIGKHLNEKLDIILNGGECEIGIESTIIGCTGKFPEILRLGQVTPELLEETLKIKILVNQNSKISRSGTFAKHYAPKAKISLAPANGDFNYGFIALDSISTPEGGIRLGSPRNLQEYAAGLYKWFYLADTSKLLTLVVVPPNGDGLASAIRDRISRAM